LFTVGCGKQQSRAPIHSFIVSEQARIDREIRRPRRKRNSNSRGRELSRRTGRHNEIVGKCVVCEGESHERERSDDNSRSSSAEARTLDRVGIESVVGEKKNACGVTRRNLKKREKEEEKERRGERDGGKR
jgi:hypothetical protein